MRRALAALVAVAGLAWCTSASAGTILLLSPTAPVSPPPPLTPARSVLQSTTEIRIPGHVDSRMLVAVGVGPDGAPARVVVTQRLHMMGTGDYTFVVPAPATSVGPGPGSQSQPGLRDVGIIWQGFSDRSRILSAVATLRPGPASAALPLAVQIQRAGAGWTVRLEDRAHRQVTVGTGRAKRAALVAELRQMRAWYSHPRLATAPAWYVRGAVGAGTSIPVTAPLHVTGTISSGAATTPVDEVLGSDRPPERSFTVPGPRAPTLSLRVDLLPLLQIMPTPEEVARAPRPLPFLQSALGAAATTTAYQRFLGSPDSTGQSQTSYVYRSAPRPAAIRAPAHHGGSDTLAIVLGIVLGAAALSGLAVLWARS